jgi:hypothetical protein
MMIRLDNYGSRWSWNWPGVTLPASAAASDNNRRFWNLLAGPLGLRGAARIGPVFLSWAPLLANPRLAGFGPR